MDKSKVLEFFDGVNDVKGQIHVIGCGAIGSHVAEELARIGCEKIHLWDFDTVSPHNITNQMFTEADIKRLKVEAVADMMTAINPALKDTLVLHPNGIAAPYIVNGYVFLCVDSIDLRKKIVEGNRYNPNIKGIFDFRMRLTDAQHYFADFSKPDDVKELLTTMDFTDEEAKAATPVSACGVELSVVYTVKAITAFGICNFVNFCQERPVKNKIFVDMNQFAVDAFPM